MTSERLTDDELEHARRRQADPLTSVSQTETRLLAEVERLRDLAEEHRQRSRHLLYDVQALQLERERLEGELSRLRAENTTQPGLVEERNQLLTDVKWLTSEFGVDHWRDCDSVGCYRCDGHWEIQERWQHASALGLVQDREGQADA